MMKTPPHIRRLCTDDAHHFFGYYGVNPYDASGRYHLALETDFQDHRPRCGEKARVGVIDGTTGQFETIGETQGFNFQQGAMLNWIYTARGEEVCYNDVQDGKLVTVLVHRKTGARRILEGGVSGVAAHKPLAIGLNYLRNFQCRKVVGYDAGQAGRPSERIPEDDGLFVTNLETGIRKCIVTIRQVADALPMAETRKGWLWLDHTLFNPSATRIMFFARVCRADGRGWYSSLWTVNTDGSDLRNQVDYTHFISHYDWLDDTTLLLSADIGKKTGFYTFHDNRGDFTPFYPGLMPRDGHACFSPDRRWLACDVCPSGDTHEASLFAIDLTCGKKIELGRYAAPPLYRGDIRCDLHPRWHADSLRITFDSVHGETRQIYEVDLRGEREQAARRL
jgi:hypothetical protein